MAPNRTDFAAGRAMVLLDERARAQLVVRLLQLRFGVHHDWTVPRNRFFDRLPGNEQEADAFVARLHDDFVAGVEEDERSVPGFTIERGGAWISEFILHCARFRCVAETA